MSDFKKTAFTLTEVLLAVGISAVVATLTIGVVKHEIVGYTNSSMAYSAMNTLSTAVYDLAAKGCSANDMKSEDDAICAGTIGEASIGHISFSSTTSGGRGFCDRLVDEEFNTVNSDCSQTASSDFDSATPNFTAPNGMRFFFSDTGAVDSDGNPDPCPIGYGHYTVYVDIDGKGKRTGTENVDVLKFYILMDGTVLPDPDGIAANSTDYLKASVRYIDSSNKYVYVLEKVPYRQAVCAAVNDGTQPDAMFGMGSHNYYCEAQVHYPAVNMPVSPCGDTATCEVVLEKPAILGN